MGNIFYYLIFRVAAIEAIFIKKQMFNLLLFHHNNNTINRHTLIIRPQYAEDEVEVDLG